MSGRADRGKLHFVARLMSDVTASAVSVRVIGYWAPGAHEPWRIATSRTDAARSILARKGPRQSFVTIGVRATAIAPPPVVLDPDRIRRLLQPPDLRALSAMAGAK